VIDTVINLIGLFAGALTTLAFLPQVVKTWRLGRADDLSLGMLLAFSLGVGLWNVYGLLIHAAPIVVANAITLVLALALVGLKIRFSR
jgi:MtN3 and saliva related transmembrane protein